MMRKPTLNDSDDDILRLQQEFLRNSSTKPAATLVNRKVENKPMITNDNEIIDVAVPVLSGILEKNLNVTSFEFKPPKRQDISLLPSTSSRRDDNVTISASSLSQRGEESDIESLKRAIHLENVNRLSNMSQDEISKEREELLSKMDPSLIEFLRRGKCSKAAADKAELKKSTFTDGRTAASLVKRTTQWHHMNEPEPEKMAWMSHLPDITSKELYTARFDFKGDLVPRDGDVEVAAGLHHHGNEPEAAGYTVEELLRLCRSQSLSQRVLALSTLAEIVAKAKSGAFDKVLLPPTLMKSLLENNVCTVIRLALDDATESVVVASCRLLAAFLYSEVDEVCLDIAFGLSFDVSQLSFVPSDAAAKTRAEDAEVEQLDDEALCNADMILGLLQMGILNRLRYILEVLRPKSGRCVADIFSALIRVARHSKETCEQLLECPRLMKIIVDQFVPKNWRHGEFTSSRYPEWDFPFWGAIKLLRLMASWGCDIANILVNQYHVDEALIFYIVREPEELMLPSPDARLLIIESYRLWSQLVMFGLCTNYFGDLFETMINHLRSAVSLEAPHDRRQFQLDRAAASSLLVERFIGSAHQRGPVDVQLQLKGMVDVLAMALVNLLQKCEADAHVSYHYFITALTNCITSAVACECPFLNRSQLHAIVTEIVPKFQASFGDRFEKESTPPRQTAVYLLERDPPGLPSLESVGGRGLVDIVRSGSLCPLFGSLRRLTRAVEGFVSE